MQPARAEAVAEHLQQGGAWTVTDPTDPHLHKAYGGSHAVLRACMTGAQKVALRELVREHIAQAILLEGSWKN